MSIRTKLKILSIVTLIGLGLIAFITISGLNAIRDAEEAAHRRQSYVADLIEIKASALSTIMLDPTTPETKEVFSEAASNIARHGKAAVDVIRRSEVRDELKKILAQWDSYNEASLKLLQLAAGDARLTNEKLLSLYKGEFRPFLAALEKFVAVRQDEAAQGVEQAKDVSRKILIETILVIVLVTVVNVAMVFSLSLSLQSALEGIQRQLVPLRQGDLTQRLPERNGDELGEIAAGVNAFVQEVQHIVQGTRDQSNHLANASFQLAAAAERVLQGSTQQSDATASVAASVEEFSVSIDQVSNNASQAEQKATLSGELSRNGGAEVFDAVAEIRHIEQVVSNAAEQIQALGEQARGISSIVNVIKEVADQTNLLALNAAIEAARAGEAGRGFAVVADEVRLLAERTSASAQEITSMVTSIQQSTETATGMMQQGNELVIQGVKQIEQAGNSMQQINDSSAGVRGAVSEISTSLNEQRIASVEIAKNVERIALMTEEGRTTASEVSAAARDLEQLAEALQKEVARFTV